MLVATRGFLVFAVTSKEAPLWVLGQLYELAEARELPLEAQGEDGGGLSDAGMASAARAGDRGTGSATPRSSRCSPRCSPRAARPGIS